VPPQAASQDAAERLYKAKTEADNAATRRAMVEMMARLFPVVNQ
jgi:hypothetical protein